MGRIEHNAPDFHYRVGYQLRDAPIAEEVVKNLYDWNQRELVVDDQKTFTAYIIYVQAVNALGTAPLSFLERKIGFSGQDGETTRIHLLVKPFVPLKIVFSKAIL